MENHDTITPALPGKARTYPIVGHSYIPPDRVFGRIEKEVKARENIVGPQEYLTLFEKFGTVYNLGTDASVNDWKTAVVGKVVKLPTNWHFKFQPSKRIIISKSNKGIKVRGETGYNIDVGVEKSICKRGKSWNETLPGLISKGVLLKPEKMGDIKKLLSNHYGENWDSNEQLRFYKQICIDHEEMTNGVRDSHEEDDEDDDIGEIPEEGDTLGI